MEVQELFKTIENFQRNFSAGLVVVIYYIIVYWPKIKDGLGLSSNKKIDLDKIEKNYSLLKLRIEIEQLKKNSGLDQELLDKLEREMLARQEVKKEKPFTPAQKFIAIPILIFITLLMFMDLSSTQTNTKVSEIDTIIGGFFVAIITIVGFWGLPFLHKTKNNILRKAGFIIFWGFAFYIVSFMLIYITTAVVSNTDKLSDSINALIFLISVACSVALGLMGRLPFMRSID